MTGEGWRRGFDSGGNCKRRLGRVFSETEFSDGRRKVFRFLRWIDPEKEFVGSTVRRTTLEKQGESSGVTPLLVTGCLLVIRVDTHFSSHPTRLLRCGPPTLYSSLLRLLFTFSVVSEGLLSLLNFGVQVKRLDGYYKEQPRERCLSCGKWAESVSLSRRFDSRRNRPRKL